MGAVIRNSSDGPLLVMEYMEFGSLYDLLHNESVALEGEHLLAVLSDVAQGMRCACMCPYSKHVCTFLLAVPADVVQRMWLVCMYVLRTDTCV
jgi:hypothetical protein